MHPFKMAMIPHNVSIKAHGYSVHEPQDHRQRGLTPVPCMLLVFGIVLKIRIECSRQQRPITRGWKPMQGTLRIRIVIMAVCSKVVAPLGDRIQALKLTSDILETMIPYNTSN
jgi:hypothetical protein